MRISINVQMQYRFVRPNTAFYAIEAADTDGQAVIEQALHIENAQIHRIAGDSDIGQRIWAQHNSTDMRLNYQAQVDILREKPDFTKLSAHPLHELPADVAPYLRPSRYCQSDKFYAFQNKRFGHLEGGEKVAAMRDWIEEKLTYVPGASDADTNVLETFASRQGVCRDYAHLMCALARAGEIPARVVACYGADVTPMDFHAVAQVWLDGSWHLVDATGMCEADAIVIVAVGRDAYDIAFMSSQAPANFVNQQVTVTRG